MAANAECPFCDLGPPEQLVLRGSTCFVMRTNDPVLLGSMMILPLMHRETLFDLTDAEWEETRQLLKRVRSMLDDELSPDGYNVGWNVAEVGGQSIPHAHLHVIPRFADEPMSGKGIRHHLKQPTNRRQSAE